MKPTRRRNGKHMLTLQPPRRHMDGYSLACMVAALVGYGEFDVGECLTRTRLEKAARSALGHRGADLYAFWRDELSDDEVAEQWSWAAGQVARLYPEMAPEVGADDQ